MRTVVLCGAILALVACRSGIAGDPAVQAGAGAGATPDTAIEIRAGSSAEGVPAEYAWIRTHLPGARIERQALVLGEGGKAWDRFDVVLPSGEARAVYFDISSFFGRRP